MDEAVLINIQTAHRVLTSSKEQRNTEHSSVLYPKIVNIRDVYTAVVFEESQKSGEKKRDVSDAWKEDIQDNL